jgi:hypothetical protein
MTVSKTVRRGSSPWRRAKLCSGGRVVQCNGLQNRKTVSSNLTRYSILRLYTVNIVSAVEFFIASETWKSERFYKPFSARLAFLRGFDPLRWYQF